MLPSEEYGQRRSARESQVTRFEKIHIQFGNIRLLLAASAVVVAWASLRAHYLSAWWLFVPIAAFGGIACWHSQILRSGELAQRAVAFYERGLARIEGRWAGTGETGERFNDPHHVYAADLDLFGDASLFQLLSSARTRIGEVTLAAWLLSPSKVDEIRGRNAAVSELRDQIDLREDLAVLGEDAGVGVHPAELVKWAESPNQMKRPWMTWFAPAAAVLATAAAIVWAIWGTLTPFVLIVAVEALLTYSLREPVDAVTHGTENAFHGLDVLSGVVARIESHTFHEPRLEELQRELRSKGVPASMAIARLRTLVDFINSRHNVLVRIIDAPLMYSVQVALAAERWRKAHGHEVKTWLDVVGEIEALVSLAAYSFEHPGDPFPEFVEGNPAFEAEELGHPLLPAASCVRNAVTINGATRSRSRQDGRRFSAV